MVTANNVMRGRAPNRWGVVLGAVLIQLSLGAIYAWSVFTPALIVAGWTKVETQIVFAIGLVTFALVMLFAGRGMARLGPRKLAAAGGLTLGAGYVLAGLLGGTNFWAVCLGVGLIGGAGIGLGYVVPIAVGMRWFPDKKGMITGLAVAGFGLFGITSYSMDRRKKEIGVRKVLGSTIVELVLLLFKSYGIQISIAFIIAAPIGFLFANEWTNVFSYREAISPLIFLLAGLIVSIFTFMMVIYKVIHAASLNPVDILKDE